MNSFINFFSNLPSRFRKENDLSDFTWAMCQASEDFKEIWVRFFFPDIIVDEIESIEREVPDEQNSGSRVDFLITLKNDSSPYLIEVKIWDQNHHFGQYEKSYRVDKSRLGYITNYFLKQDGYEIKQWREFYETLVSALEKGRFSNEDSLLIDGYCKYLKNVCGFIMVTEKIDITKMTSLYDLTVVLRDIVLEYHNERIEVYNYNTTNRDDIRWLFVGANYKEVESWNSQYLFMGIIYRHPEPYLCAGFDGRKDWARTIMEYMKNHTDKFHLVNNKYISIPEISDSVYFYLSDFALAEFQSAETIDQQKSILKDFFEEVLLFPIRLKKLVDASEGV